MLCQHLSTIRRRRCPDVQHVVINAAGYRSIGSFHNDNLAEMLALPDDMYQAPPLPFDLEPQQQQEAAASIATTSISNNFQNDFSLDLRSWTFLNHGAFGAALRVGQDRAALWRLYAETQPLRYHDRALLPHLAHAARSLAKYLVGRTTTTSSSSSSSPSYALLPNVTSGMNCILSNYTAHYGRDGHIIMWDSTYGSVKAMARHYGRHGRVTEIPLLGHEYLIHSDNNNNSRNDVVTQALLDHVGHLDPNAAPPPLLLLEHTTSNTALTFDLRAAVLAARTHVHPHTWVVVDGAHGLWAHDTKRVLAPQNDDDDISSAIDVYIANGHKWLSAPRGVALAWVRNAAATETLLQWPAVLSHGMHAPDLFSRFVWDGCRDYTAALAVPAVLEYWQEQHDATDDDDDDESSLRLQVRRDLWQGLAHLAHVWHGLPNEDGLLCNQGWARGLMLASEEWLDAPMALLRLPSHCDNGNNNYASNDAKRIQDYLYCQQVEVPIKCINGKLYVRISNHVYNRLEDMERLGQVLQK